MTTPQIILFAIFGAVLALMLWGRWRYDLVAFGGLLAGVLLGVVPSDKAFSGFGHPATMVVALILIATAGLTRSGAVAWLSRKLAKPDRPISLHIAVMGAVGTLLSGFMNNIAALAILMPVDIRVARKAGRAAAITLMPLAFATILGGMLTLIGTPPNLLVSSFRSQVLGAPYKMFDFLPVGGAVALAGLTFIALIGWRLVPVRTKPETESTSKHFHGYVAELVVTDATGFVGKMVSEIEDIASRADVSVLGVERRGHRVPGLLSAISIEIGDLLLIEAAPDALDEFRASNKLAYPDGRAGDRPLPEGGGQVLIEAVVRVGGDIVGRTAKGFGLSARHNTVLMGIRRRGETIYENLRRTRILPGDILLLLIPEDRISLVLNDAGAFAISDAQRPVTLSSKMATAVGLFAAAVIATSFGLTTMPVALGVVVVAYVLTGILSLNELYDHVDWPIIVLLGSMIPLGFALDDTGGSALIASGLAALVGGWPAWVALAVLMAVTMVLSDILNNNATTIIAAPVGIRLAEQLGVNPDAFLMGVAVSASCAFLTPIGHQNNTLILGPGGYRFSDYWRMGLPLEVVVMLVSVPMLLIVWPL